MAVVNDVIIRRYIPSDLHEVKQIFTDGMKTNGLDAAHTDEYIKRSLTSDLSSIDATYLSGRGTFLVMESLTESKMLGIVGMQDLTINGEEQAQAGEGLGDAKKNTCELRRMSIHASERRKGRGKQLVEEFISVARGQGFDEIVLTTGSWMTHAISFYLSVGFEDVGISQYTPSDGRVVTLANLAFKLSV